MQFAQSLTPIPLGIGKWFPISYGHPRTPTSGQVLFAFLTVAGFAGSIRLLAQAPKRFHYPIAILVGSLTILGTTATQGWQHGFVHPVAGKEPHARPAQYWHDTQAHSLTTGTEALHFVQNYSLLQPTLTEHGRTHPPGAILLYAVLRQVSGNNSGITAIILCVLAVGLVALAFRLGNLPPFTLLLFCVLPAVQIYFCATLDAVIAGLLAICILGNRHVWLTAITLFLASFLTFGVVWVVPVLFAVEIARTQRFPWRTGVILVAMGLSYVLIKAPLRI